MRVPAEMSASPFGSFREDGAATRGALLSAGALSALRRLLPDFDAVGVAPPRPAGPEPLDVAPAPEPDDEPAPLPALPAVDPTAEAVAAALAEAELRHAAALDACGAAQAEALAAARARWAAEEGAALAEGLRAAVGELGDALGAAAAEALAPLVGEAGRGLAVEGLRDAVADLVRAGAAGTVTVSGPADLLDALRDALDAAGLPVETMTFAPSDRAEVTLAAGDSRVETRLAAWAEALRRRWAGPRSGLGAADAPGARDGADEDRA